MSEVISPIPLLLRWLVATLHLLTLPLGLGAVWMRARALRHVRTAADLPPVFTADNLWGLAAFLWIATGLWRVLGSLEKPTGYYIHAPVFYAKMGLFLLVFLLELWPMITLIRWRGAVRRGVAIDTAPAAALAQISQVQIVLVVVIAFAATALARGFFF